MKDELAVIFIGPMKIPIPSEKGAIEEVIWQIAKNLNIKSYIFNPIFGTNNKILHRILSIFAVYRLMPFNGLIIHSHSQYPSISLTINKKKWQSHILTLHYPPFGINITLIRYLFENNVLITVPSINIKEALAEKGIYSVYIPNGVNTKFFNPRNRDEGFIRNILPTSDFVFVNIGRFTKEKNQMALVKAFEKISDKYKRVGLILVGPKSGNFMKKGVSDYYCALLNCIKGRGLDKRICMIEAKSRAEVAKILASCDVYVHPSIIEAAAPLAILEAMASGLPIIAFNLPWYKGYLYDGINATICAPKIESLCEAMVSYAELGVNEKMRKKQVAFAENFSWRKIAKKYEALYKVQGDK